ncbi:MAG: hypothetical protein E6929_01035 [Clostridium sp.]|nr:hypothetical protein [Clostridium sp.]
MKVDKSYIGVWINLIIFCIIRFWASKYLTNDSLLTIAGLGIIFFYIYSFVYKCDKLIKKYYFYFAGEMSILWILLAIWVPMENIFKHYKIFAAIMLIVITVVMFRTIFKIGKLNGRI